jgi:hypothetical protein
MIREVSSPEELVAGDLVVWVLNPPAGTAGQDLDEEELANNEGFLVGKFKSFEFSGSGGDVARSLRADMKFDECEGVGFYFDGLKYRRENETDEEKEALGNDATGVWLNDDKLFVVDSREEAERLKLLCSL